MRTATACSARCTTRKMWFRRRICGPGARSVTSKAGPNFGIGSTGSLRTPRCGSWRRATAAHCHPAWAIRSRNPPTTTRSNVGIFRGWNRSRPLSCTRRQNHRIRQTSFSNGRASGWRSWQHFSICRRGNAPCCCCATCWRFERRRSQDCSTSAPRLSEWPPTMPTGWASPIESRMAFA